MINWFKATTLKHAYIGKEDLNIFKVVDKPEDVVSVIKKFYEEH